MTLASERSWHPSISNASLAMENSVLSCIIQTQNDVAAVELDPQRVMQVIVERTRILTHADGALLETLEGEEFVARAASGSTREIVGTRMPAAGSASGRAISSGLLLHIPDTEGDSHVNAELCRRYNIRSMILVPLAHNARHIGILKLISHSPNAFNEQTALALQLMAGLLAAALTHASEFEIKKRLLAERTAALHSLRESEERFRASFENAAIGMALVSLDGRWLRVNRSLCRITGYTEQELLVTDFQSITYPADLGADMAHVRRLINGEAIDYQMVKRYIHKRGHIVWVHLNASLVRDDAGKPLYFISHIEDISLRQQAEEALRRSEEQFRTTFELAPLGKTQVDLTTGRFICVNRKFAEITGYSQSELLCKTFNDITHPEDRAAAACAAAGMLDRTRPEISIEKRYIRKDGRVIWISVSGVIIPGPSGEPLSIASVLDITERKHSEQLEQDRRHILEMVVKDRPIHDVLAELARAVNRQVTDALCSLVLLQEGSVQLYGCDLPKAWQSALGRHLLPTVAQLSAPAWDSPDTIGVSFMRSDAVWEPYRDLAQEHNLQACWTIPLQTTENPPVGLLTVFCQHARRPAVNEARTLDMAAKLATICIEHHNTTHQLAHLVRHDHLTGLPNRIMFEDRLQHALALARRTNRQVAVLLLDVDKFKGINDTLGHHAGDSLLQQFSQRLLSRLRTSDTMARLGGDEFAICLPNLASRDEAIAAANRLLAAMEDPFDVEVACLRVTTSIGIAIFPGTASDPVYLQKNADAALYRAKAAGRACYSF